MTYADFLSTKLPVAKPCGIDVALDDLHPALKAHQRLICRWALAKGRAAVWCDTGLGKSLIALEWARRLGQRTLILAPLSVAQQFVREGEKWGIPCVYARDESEAPAAGIVTSNYERLERFEASKLAAVVLDECFARGTLVDTPSGRKHIEELQLGDRIFNAAGVDTVADVHRREVPYAVRIAVGGEQIVSSPNHPYFTQRGWVAAQDLLPGDSLMARSAALRLVRGGLHSPVFGIGQAAVLQSVLLSEMADESARERGEAAHRRGREEARREEAGLVGVGAAGGAGRTGAHQDAQPHQSARGAREDLPPIESDPPQTFRAWGQWPWLDGAAADSAGCARRELDAGVCFVTGPADSWVSDALQAGLGLARAQNRHRGGWALPRDGGLEGAGREEGGGADFARVDGLEVLQSGHPDLECLRDADGKLYFYDLGATRHPSFAVAGFLVHNSSILANWSGETKRALIRRFRATPYKLACTATPAPNDTVELCNHADFLGVMPQAAMLARFFTPKGVENSANGEYRIKPHARRDFFRWLASWAVACKTPSDLGCPDDGYVLPPLEIVPEIVPTDWAPPGQLFLTKLKGVVERAGVRRETIGARVGAAARLVAREPGHPWLLWYGLLDEAAGLERAIPGAVVLRGSDTAERKDAVLSAFSRGEVPVLVTHAGIAGFGMNFQACARMAFVGLSDSYQVYYQAIRRCWRFGQTRPVRAHIVLAEPERAVYENVLRKEREAGDLTRELVAAMRDFEQAELSGRQDASDPYEPTRPIALPAWLHSQASEVAA